MADTPCPTPHISDGCAPNPIPANYRLVLLVGFCHRETQHRLTYLPTYYLPTDQVPAQADVGFCAAAIPPFCFPLWLSHNGHTYAYIGPHSSVLNFEHATCVHLWTEVSNLWAQVLLGTYNRDVCNASAQFKFSVCLVQPLLGAPCT